MPSRLPTPGSPILLSSDALASTAALGAGWMMGHAQHTGLLRRPWPPAVVCVARTLICRATANAAFTCPHPTDRVAIDVAPAPILYSFASLLLHGRFRPSVEWLSGVPVRDHLASSVTAIAMTIYLRNSEAAIIAGLAVVSSKTHYQSPCGPYHPIRATGVLI